MASQSASPQADATPEVGNRQNKISVCCRVRPLLAGEIAKGTARAPWVLTGSSIALGERYICRPGETRDADAGVSKTKSEVRNLQHIRRGNHETAMDAVYGEDSSTQEIYEKSFRNIVAGAAEGLNGAILAYGQTASGKTYSISGSTAKPDEEGGTGQHKGIIHFALEDLFQQLHAKASTCAPSGDDDVSKDSGHEFLVRMSYCEVYMERVNDLLRKISPQSQNLPVKEDAETKSFYVEGLKEKIVGSPEEVTAQLAQAEKRRRVAYTKYNEVSSRSHSLLTLTVESTSPFELEGESNTDTASGDEPRLTKVGRLVIVDLAGNERMEAGTEYMAESNSINQSLFFLGKVIEKLSGRERRERQSPDHPDDLECTRSDHVPIRDSKLTRLLAVNLGGNSQTGMLVTLTPAEEYVEQSLTTLRFAQKASTIRCVAKPVLISKEQSLIIKQREIIAQLHQQVRELKEAERHRRETEEPSQNLGDTAVTTRPNSVAGSSDPELAAERRQCVEELRGLTVGPGSPKQQAFVSKSREVDAIVTALHRNNDTLRRQKATVVDGMRDFHKAVRQIAEGTSSAAKQLQAGAVLGTADNEDLLPPPTASSRDGRGAAWEPTIHELHMQIRALLQAAAARILLTEQEGEMASKAAATLLSESTTGMHDLQKRLHDTEKENCALRHALTKVSKSADDIPLHEANARLQEENAQLRSALADSRIKGSSDATTAQQLREENSRLRASMRFLTEEADRLRAEAEQSRSEDVSRAVAAVMSPCKRSDGTGGRASPWIHQDTRRRASCLESSATDCDQQGRHATQTSEPPLAGKPSAPVTDTASEGGTSAACAKLELGACARVGAGDSTQRPNMCAGSLGPAATTCMNREGGNELASLSGTLRTVLPDSDPIIHRAASPSRNLSPLRHLSKSTDLWTEVEPILEQCAPDTETAHGKAAESGLVASRGCPKPPRSGKSPVAPKPPPPTSHVPEVPSAAGRLAMGYFRQMGVRTTWQPGDTAYWRGQLCRVVRAMPEDQPLRVVLRTPDGTEVTTDVCLLSEAPSASKAALSAPESGEAGRPLRLAPLGELCFDRPALLERPPMLPSPRERRACGSTGAGRSSSMPARAVPLRPLENMDSHSRSARRLAHGETRNPALAVGGRG